MLLLFAVAFNDANACEGNTKGNTKEYNTEGLPLPFVHPFHVVVDVEEGIQIPDDQIVAYIP